MSEGGCVRGAWAVSHQAASPPVSRARRSVLGVQWVCFVIERGERRRCLNRRSLPMCEGGL